MAFSPDGKFLATGSDEITIWDMTTGEVRSRWPAPDGFRALYGAFAPDAGLLAVAGEIGPDPWCIRSPNPVTIRTLNAGTGQLVAKMPTTETWIESLSFSGDGRVVRAILSSMGESPKLVTWDARSGEVVPTQPFSLPTNPVTSVGFSHDGQMMAFASGQLEVTLYDLTNGAVRCVLRADTPSEAITGSVGFSTDDAMLALGRRDGSVEIWDLTSCQQRMILKGHTTAFVPCDFEFSPNRKTLLSLAGSRTVLGLRLVRSRVEYFLGRRETGIVELVVWDIASGHPLAKVEDEWPMLFSPDGRMLVTRPFYEDDVLRIRTIPQTSR